MCLQAESLPNPTFAGIQRKLALERQNQPKIAKIHPKTPEKFRWAPLGARI
jgi:hypothetical protein